MENPTFSSARDSDDPLIGQLIEDRYRIERVLGTGGTGTVYLAEHVMMEKRVALKVLHATHAVISSAMDRFQREAIALARIEHPNVVSATDFGKLKNGAYYLALEYVEGVSLGEVLARETVLDKDRALNIAYQVASALQAAHSQNIVHRDLKPHNVMLTRVGETEIVKVLDFGLAKLRSKATQGSISMSAGQVFGTPHYMAPEQIIGEGVDQRVDLYALGVILYEMLCGTRPFESTDVREILSQQATQEPPPLPETVPAPLRALVARLLKKQKEERPESSEEVLAELSAMVSLPETGLLGWLRRQVPIGPLSVPVWGLALPATAFLALFTFGLLVTKSQPARTGFAVEPVVTVVSVPASNPAVKVPAPDRTPALLADAEFGDDKAIEELLRVPPEARSRELWLVLAKGRIAQDKVDSAMQLLRQAVHLKDELENDDEVAALVRKGASDTKGSKLALATAAETLGYRGVDILFSVWADTRRRTPTTALAEQYLENEKVRERASPALRLALTLRDEVACPDVRKLVTEAKAIGDSRSLRPLAQMRKTRGCGPGKKQDCYACLRDDDLLETAIAAAAERIGPKY